MKRPCGLLTKNAMRTSAISLWGMITSNLEQEIALFKEQARLWTEQEKSKIEEYTSLSDSLKELLCWDSGVPLETLLYVTPFCAL